VLGAVLHGAVFHLQFKSFKCRRYIVVECFKINDYFLTVSQIRDCNYMSLKGWLFYYFCWSPSQMEFFTGNSSELNPFIGNLEQ
jgi:hypothetical protein